MRFPAAAPGETWNGRKLHIGGMGGVSTRPDCRTRGYATVALSADDGKIYESHIALTDANTLQAEGCADLRRRDLDARRTLVFFEHDPFGKPVPTLR